MTVVYILFFGLAVGLLAAFGRGGLGLVSFLAGSRGWRQILSVKFAARRIKRSLSLKYRCVSVRGEAISFHARRRAPLFRILLEDDREVTALESDPALIELVTTALKASRYPYSDFDEVGVLVRSLEEARRVGHWYNLWN